MIRLFEESLEERQPRWFPHSVPRRTMTSVWLESMALVAILDVTGSNIRSYSTNKTDQAFRDLRQSDRGDGPSRRPPAPDSRLATLLLA